MYFYFLIISLLNLYFSKIPNTEIITLKAENVIFPNECSNFPKGTEINIETSSLKPAILSTTESFSLITIDNEIEVTKLNCEIKEEIQNPILICKTLNDINSKITSQLKFKKLKKEEIIFKPKNSTEKNNEMEDFIIETQTKYYNPNYIPISISKTKRKSQYSLNEKSINKTFTIVSKISLKEKQLPIFYSINEEYKIKNELECEIGKKNEKFIECKINLKNFPIYAERYNYTDYDIQSKDICGFTYSINQIIQVRKIPNENIIIFPKKAILDNKCSRFEVSKSLTIETLSFNNPVFKGYTQDLFLESSSDKNDKRKIPLLCFIKKEEFDPIIKCGTLDDAPKKLKGPLKFGKVNQKIIFHKIEKDESEYFTIFNNFELNDTTKFYYYDYNKILYNQTINYTFDFSKIDFGEFYVMFYYELFDGPFVNIKERNGNFEKEIKCDIFIKYNNYAVCKIDKNMFPKKEGETFYDVYYKNSCGEIENAFVNLIISF